MIQVETKANHLWRTRQQQIPSESANERGVLFQESQTHSGRRRSGRMLLLERLYDGVERLFKQAGSLFARRHQMRRSVLMT